MAGNEKPADEYELLSRIFSSESKNCDVMAHHVLCCFVWCFYSYFASCCCLKKKQSPNEIIYLYKFINMQGHLWILNGYRLDMVNDYP